MRSHQFFVCIGIVSLGIFGCQKSGGSKSEDPGSQNQPNGSDRPPEGGNTGKNKNNGDGTPASVRFGISAISAQGAFGETLAAQNGSATPGSLAISLGLIDDPSNGNELFYLVPPDLYRTPVLPSSSIASGAPTEMVLRIKKIELLDKPQSGQSNDPDSMGPVALTEGVVDQRFGNLPPEKKSALSGIVGRVYEKATSLIGAIAEITGETPDTIMNQRLAEVGDALFEAGRELSGAGPSHTVLFEDSAGRPVILANGNVDLSQLMPGSDKSAELKAAAGRYGAVRVTYASKAQIKGCVRMKYKCMNYQQSGTTCHLNASTADIPGLNDTSGQEAILEYCTQAAKSPYVSGTQNSDFLNKVPELMDFPLDLPNAEWPKSEDIRMEYALDKPVELKPETPAKLTLAVDLNRMLRYYNRGRQDQSVNPGAPMDKAFFFTTVFADSTHVFVGEPGRIYGYEMIARVCPNGVAYDTGSGSCAGNASFHTSVPFWMTLITGSNGGPVKMIMMPDDDNDFTITKGSDRDAVRCAIDATPNEPRKPWVRVTSGSSTGEIHYALCDNEDDSNPPRPGPHGHLSGFPVALDTATVVPGSTAIDLTPTGSDYVQGVTIYTNQRQNASTSGNIYHGKVVVLRRL